MTELNKSETPPTAEWVLSDASAGWLVPVAGYLEKNPCSHQTQLRPTLSHCLVEVDEPTPPPRAGQLDHLSDMRYRTRDDEQHGKLPSTKHALVVTGSPSARPRTNYSASLAARASGKSRRCRKRTKNRPCHASPSPPSPSAPPPRCPPLSTAALQVLAQLLIRRPRGPAMEQAASRTSSSSSGPAPAPHRPATSSSSSGGTPPVARSACEAPREATRSSFSIARCASSSLSSCALRATPLSAHSRRARSAREST
jgi:hypothetical protein